METRHLLVCLLTICSAASQRHSKGSMCLVGDGRLGVCADIKDCPYAQQLVHNGRMPKPCYFELNRPVVCCPKDGMVSSTTETTTTRLGTTPSFLWMTPDTGDHSLDSQCGDACVLDDGGVGTCTAITNCPHAAEQQEDGVEPQVCFYDRRRPVVCCPRGAATSRPTPTRRTTPMPTTTTTTPTHRPTTGNDGISWQKCQEYADRFLDGVDLPSPSFGDDVDLPECPQLEEPMAIGDLRCRPKEYPHMAALGYGDSPGIEWLCGGSLISHRFVLTAASCIATKDSGRVRWVRLGDLNMASTRDVSRPQTVEVESAIAYPDYKATSLYDDIGLLRLKARVIFDSFVRPACLDTKVTTTTGETVKAIGWGIVDQFDAGMSEFLMKSRLKIVSPTQCNASYASVIASTDQLVDGVLEHAMVCAGDPDGERDFCMLDSGSPLQVSLEEPFCMTGLVGVASFSNSVCKDTNVPGVFTRVAHYVPWIESIVWP